MLAKERGHWAGLPMPSEHARLVMAPNHPEYERLNGATLAPDQSSNPEDEKLELVNCWYNDHERSNILVIRENGRVTWGRVFEGPGRRIKMLLDAALIAQTMDMAAETRALETLSTLVSKHLYHGYRMTGAFIETSKRSGVTYIFRRLGTTLAIRATDVGCRLLAALCLHPLGYYEQTTLGVMVPTDDVIAHLVMMRSDEHMFWRKANQHGILSPGAML